MIRRFLQNHTSIRDNFSPGRTLALGEWNQITMDDNDGIGDTGDIGDTGRLF